MSRRPLHMLGTLFFASVLLLGLTGTALAEYRVLAVQSFRVGPYQSAVEGFKSACACRIDRFVLSERRGETVENAIRDTRPDAVLAIGKEALQTLSAVRDRPVFYVMVLDPGPGASERPNRFGVRMLVSARTQMDIFSAASFGSGPVGLIYDPGRMAPFVAGARKASADAGVDLVETPLSEPGGVPGALQGMIGRIRVFWLLPDLSVVTAETVRHILLTCLSRGVPVIAFSDKYLEMGALMSISFDPKDMGAQAGGMAAAVLGGDVPPPAERHRYARTPVVRVNPKIARKLGVDINIKTLGKVRNRKRGPS